MCFSPEASFALGGALLPVGGYCVWSAWRKDRRQLALAAVPLMLGVQQASEGVVWHALVADDYRQARVAGLVFLFFALAVWPFWFALVGAVTETRPDRKPWLVALAVVTSGWFWLLFYPLLADPERMTPTVVHHSIRYALTLPSEEYVPRPVLRVVYLFSIVVPIVLGPRLLGFVPGLLLAVGAAVAGAVYEYAFASVWCFFAAVTGLGLAYTFHTLPPRAADPVAAGGYDGG